MAQITFFHYIYKDTPLHRMDGRLKLLCLILFSVSASLAKSWWQFLLAFCVGFVGIAVARLPLKALLRDVRLFLLIIVIVIVADTFAMEGKPLTYIDIPGASQEGLITGLCFAGRLISIILVCSVMTGTTSLREFSDIVEWYLKPVPFIPEARVATMINMTFVLIPVILDTYEEMMSAQKSRGIDKCKNPVRRLKYVVFPLLPASIRRADEMVYAMEARGYSEDRTRAAFNNHLIDWLVLAICIVMCAIMIIFN